MRAGAAPEDQVDTSEGMAEVGGAVLDSSGTEYTAGGGGRLPMMGGVHREESSSSPTINSNGIPEDGPCS